MTREDQNTDQPFAKNNDTAATDKNALLKAAWSPIFEKLETRKLLADVTLVDLGFDTSTPGTLVDTDGEGTGFAGFQQNDAGDGFNADGLDLDTATGLLRVTTAGNTSNFRDANTHQNVLEKSFDATAGSFTAQVRLDGPTTAFDQQFQQAGLTFGPDADHYVKVVAGRWPEGQRIEFLYESTDTAGSSIIPFEAKLDAGSLDGQQHIDLRLQINADTGTVSAGYRLPGGDWVDFGTTVTISADDRVAFFATDAKAGIVQNDSQAAPANIGYDSFSLVRHNGSEADRPTVTGVNPADGATGVTRDIGIFANIAAGTSGGRIDQATLNANTVYLERTDNGQRVTANVQTSGAGDVIILTPSGSVLDANTDYTFVITDGVKDILGNAVVPFTSSFTTGTAGGTIDTSISFDRTQVALADGERWTGVTFGPDGRLYATTLDGLIYRFDVDADGAFSNKTEITTLRDDAGFRALIGLTFDPTSTADNLIAYAIHGDFEGILAGDARDWTGKISVLSGDDLGNIRDLVTGLPRSVGDHLTNQASFGPDGMLYLSQAANTAMGASDPTWSEANGTPRPERLLTAAILRIDVAAIGTGTVDVQTADTDTPYDPFAADAPVTLFATGVRNAYDLLWHSNGTLYAPTNGSGNGGNTPADPSQTGTDLTNVPEVQRDYLFAINQGGYYGSPNPVRNEFILNGGNPTAGVDPHEVATYPVGTQPDANWRVDDIAFDFGLRVSPNGIIEYRDDASTGSPFGGDLDGKIFVVRYATPQDILILTPGAGGGIVDARDGFSGLEDFAAPIDIIQQPGTGNLLVADLGTRAIYLLQPAESNAAPGNATVSDTTLYFNDNHTSGDRSPAQAVTVTNTGAGPLTLNGFDLDGADPADFRITGQPIAGTVLGAGESITLSVDFRADAKRIHEATLTIDTTNNDVIVRLRGIGTTGLDGQNEPSLQRILDLYEIPVNVGDPDPNTTHYPDDSSLRGDEVIAPRFTKAGPGEVSIEVLATMAGQQGSNSLIFGTYEPGTPQTMTELFRVAAEDRQSVNPGIDGVTTFDPGSDAFALWSSYAAFDHRVVYGEDVLNTWENNPDQRRKVRVFPLKDANGDVVPNAYVVGFEEWEQQSDQNDIVFVIRNVAPVVGAELGIENLDNVPFADRLVFSRISPDGVDTVNPNTVHDTATLRIRNTGESPLTINDLQLSSNEFEIIAGDVSSPVTLGRNEFRDVTVRFIYDRAGDGQEVRNATLTIISNDADEANRQVQLAGLWQSDSENNSRGISQEPKVTTIIEALGYSIDVGDVDTGGAYEAAGEETLSRYWTRADDSKPVGVRILGAWHGQGTPSQNSASTVRWFPEGNAGQRNFLFRHAATDGQTLLPRHSNGGPGYAEFTTNGNFGFFADGSYSDEQFHDNLNNEHAWRFYAAKDRDGNIIPGAYIAAHDYVGATFTNYDYQDNVYLITNVKPVTGPVQVADLTATPANGVTLNWAANTAGNVIGYDVFRDTGSGFVKLTDTPTAQTTFIDAGASGSATYRVVAVDYQGTSGTPADIQGNGDGTGGEVTQPATPTALAASLDGNQVILSWNDNATNETGYQIERSTNGGPFSLLTSAPANSSTYVDLTTTSATTYQYRVRAINSAGASAFSNVVTATTPASNVYSSTDIGSPALGSTAQLAPNVNYDLTAGSGSNISGNADNFRFLHRAISGDFDIAVTLQDITGPDEGVGGIMARSSLGSGSAHVSVLFSADRLGNFAYRDANGGSTTTTGNAAAGRPTEVRLQRVGTTFTAYVMLDGATWTPLGTAQLALGDTLQVGFAAAGNSDAGATVRLRNIRAVSITATAPAAPTALSAVASADRITLNWTDNANDEAGFRIERSTGGAFTTLATLGPDATNYEDTTAVAGTTYTYRVVAFNGGGEATSATASATITPTATAPDAPTGLEATIVETGVSLEWFDNADNETGFRIERRTDGGSFAPLANVGANITSFLDDTTDPDTTYEYRVFAVNSAGDSGASNTVNATTPADDSGETVTVLYEQKFDGNGNLDFRTYTGGVQSGGTFDVVNGQFVADNTGGFGSWYTAKLPIPDSGQVNFSIDASSSADVAGQLNVGVRIDGGAYQLLRSFRGPIDGVITVELNDIDASQIQIEVQARTTAGQFRFDNIRITDGAAADTGGGDAGGGDGGDTGGGDTGGDTATDVLVETFDLPNGTQQGTGELPWRTYVGGVQGGGFFGVRDGAFVAENTGGFASWYTPKITLPTGGPYTFSVDVSSSADVAGQLNVGVRIAGGSYQLLQSFRNPVTGTVRVSLADIPADQFQIEIQARTTAGSFTFDNVKITEPGTDTGGGGGGDTGGGDTGNGGDNGGGDDGGGNTGGGNNTGIDFLVETFPQANGTQQGTGALSWRTYTGGVQSGGFFGVRDGRLVAENTGGFASWYTPRLNLPAGDTYRFSVDVSSSANVAGQLNVNVRIGGQSQVVQSFRDPVTGTVTVTLDAIPAGEFQIEIQARTTAGFYAFDNVRIATVGSNGSGGSDGNTGGGDDNGDDNTGPNVTGITWTDAPQPGRSYAESSKAVVGDDVFIFGGYRVDFSSVRDVYRFRNNQWTRMADMPEAITHAGVETVGNEVWFAGAYIGREGLEQIYGSRKVWKYDTTNDAWSRGPDLPVERAGGDLVLIGRNLHFLGGQNIARSVDTREHWVLNLDNQGAGWQSRADMPVGRNHLAAETHNGLLYFFGSQSGHDEGLTPHTEVYSYDPATNSWTQRASMPAPRNHMHQTLVKKEDKLYIFAGQSEHNQSEDDIFEYDFANDSWRTIGTTTEPRTSPAVALLPDGRVLMIGGFRPGLIFQATYFGEFDFA
ncbi:MAG: kelch repeat-containing protein [Planctomycetota bacterium]